MMALLIGGAQDGKVVEVPATHSVAGWEPPKPGLDPATGIVWGREVSYQRTEVNLFGVTLPVFVQQGWPAERMEATLADLLLSDLAKSLAQQ